MIELLKQSGKTYYHPILDNYPRYESFKAQEGVIKEINSSLSLAFTQSIETGKINTNTCLKLSFIRSKLVCFSISCVQEALCGY